MQNPIRFRPTRDFPWYKTIVRPDHRYALVLRLLRGGASLECGGAEHHCSTTTATDLSRYMGDQPFVHKTVTVGAT